MNTNFSFLSKTPLEIQKLIAQRIRTIRRQRKISQQALSCLSDVSLGSIKRFEQSGVISLHSLIKIAFALNLNHELEHLFEDIPPSSIEEIIHGQN